MSTVRSILEHKGHSVVTISPDETVLDAAKRMNEARIGAVVVLDDTRHVVGIFTERDMLRRVVAERKQPEGTTVREVMSSPVTCCKPTTPLSECQGVMSGKRLRHLPVIEGNELVGVVSAGDILAHEVQAQQSTIEYLHDYLHGRT